MNDCEAEWRWIASRKEARALDGFTCTTPRPVSPQGRQLPHPREWERVAQTLIRRSSQTMRPHETLLAGDRDGETVVAARIQVSDASSAVAIFIAAIGLRVSERGQGGGLVDAAFSRIRTYGVDRARDVGASGLVISGKIHEQNLASQRFADRVGMEPRGVPAESYHLWELVIEIAP